MYCSLHRADPRSSFNIFPTSLESAGIKFISAHVARAPIISFSVPFPTTATEENKKGI